MDLNRIVEFLSFWVANSLVLLLASVLFSGNVVLGNDKVALGFAALISGLVIAVITAFVPRIVNRVGYDFKNEGIWLAIFFAANVLILTVIKRFALVVGLGISGMVYVALLAAVLTAVQWGVSKALTEWLTAKLSTKRKK